MIHIKHLAQTSSGCLRLVTCLPFLFEPVAEHLENHPRLLARHQRYPAHITGISYVSH